jgi:pyrroline-5-carboxylate reductase
MRRSPSAWICWCCATSRFSGEVAVQVGGRARAVASILAGVSLTALEVAYPGAPVVRLMPNTAVEVGRGVICDVRGGLVDERLAAEVVELFARAGKVVAVEEQLIDVAMGLMAVAPAYVALIAEAWIDAGVAHGMPAEQGAELVAEAIAGSADLCSRTTWRRSGCAGL